MAVDIIMPRLGLTMEEGTIVRWHAAAGDRVAQGQVLLDVETDKVTVEVEAPATGVMGTLLISEGQKVPVGTLLGRIAAEDEILRTAPNDGAPPSEAVAPPRSRTSPLARRMAEQAGVDLGAVAPNGTGGRITAGEPSVAWCGADARLGSRPHLLVAPGQATGAGARHRLARPVRQRTTRSRDRTRCAG
jgi:pyruvate/2-oxoglutarate dehydrogenase complex dihydrolipoamide acyltransferase (E2) component